MSSETITITNYAPDRYARLMTTLAKDGLQLSGDSGEAKHDGADVTYGYNVASQTLTLDVLHGPHLMGFQTFIDKLKAYIETQQ